MLFVLLDDIHTQENRRGGRRRGFAGRERLDSWREWREGDYGVPGGARGGRDTDGQRPVSPGGPSRSSGYLRGMGVLVGASEGEEGTSVSF